MGLYFCGMKLNNGIWIGLLCLVIFEACNTKDETKKEIIKETANIPANLQTLMQQANATTNNIDLRLQLAEKLDSAKLYAFAAAQIDSLLVGDSLNSGYWLKRGQYLRRAEDTAKALKSFEYAAKIFAGDEQLIELANLYAETKNPKTITVCNMLVKSFPNGKYNDQAYFFEALYNSKINNTAKAIELYDKCLQTNFHFLDAYIEKGYLLYNQKNYKAALQVFTKLTEVSKTYADGYYWKAKCYQALNNKSEAIANYKQALTLDATIEEAKKALKDLE